MTAIKLINATEEHAQELPGSSVLGSARLADGADFAGYRVVRTIARGGMHLADFGISATLASTSGVTRTGCWVGSLDYVAPEVIQGDPAT
ncbi:MAG: hypothetical protein ACLP8S_19840, partial [Solirubrobacteraceae bacterium]